jgi:hypothetical protein
MNGSEGCDDNMVAFWPLEDLDWEPNIPATDGQGSKWFLFADFSIRGWDYAVRLSPAPGTPSTVVELASYRDDAPVVLGTTFADFLHRYLTDPDAVYG